jgi:2-polyprenyl-3-methyl-5-hydroxy-6-metoxy-1,4-benzoquinol methylase
MAATQFVDDKDAFAERLIGSVTAAMDVLGIYLGDRLGYYAALTQGPATPAELAARTKTDARYTREWLEAQAASGILRLVNPGAPQQDRRYELTPANAEVLLDQDSLSYVGPIARLFVGATSPLQRLLEAYRTGEGISFGDYGLDLREGQSEINRPVFLQALPNEWIPAMPDVHARLQQSGARVADVGCGAAWSAIGIARAFPGAQVDAFDLDEASVEMAKQNVAEAGLTERVRVQRRDAGDSDLAGQYDLVAVLEALHDMAQPVQALRTMRRIVSPTGAVMVVDEHVGDAHVAPADDLERLMYGWSLLHCLPAGRADTPSVATGTVLRPSMLRELAREAGFREIELLPVEAGFFTVYRLHH